MKLFYLIIDDEPIAHDIIKKYAKELNYLQLKKQCYTAIDAINFLQNNSVDFVFLDIEMPRIKGIDFLKTLQNPPKVIITTAYEEYALEGYELNVVDYLLKPFSFERFLKAINKLNNNSNTYNNNDVTLASETILVKGNNKIYQIRLDNILFIESIEGTVKIHCIHEVIKTTETLSFFETKFSESNKFNFVRVHKSFIIAFDKINALEGNIIHISNNKIPIGRTYKINVKNNLK